MKIALINENSQASKNKLIFEALKKVCEPLGHECFNYGRYGVEDPYERTYVQAGLLAAILLNSGAADFVITGCGTGMGAMLACNAFPGVMCGRANDPTDAYLFMQVNAGNALSLPFAYQFGWGAELNLENTFEKMFGCEIGNGYPEEWAVAEKRNREILKQIKLISHTKMIDVLKSVNQEFLLDSIKGERFQKLFLSNCRECDISEYVKKLLAII